jgi:thiol-disulfide isomerase/thioredoxin
VITRVVVSITVALALLALAGVATGITRPSADQPSAPPIAATGWLNTAPLSPADVEGKVVLYDFWTFSCINSVHTLPYVKAWYARYAADGLVVISIHTPEFEFEADPRNVADFVAKNDIEYPVALDPQRDTWRAWHNHYWPAFYVYDRAGARRYQHFGEGRYDQTEDVLRSLLGVDPSSPRARVATG